MIRSVKTIRTLLVRSTFNNWSSTIDAGPCPLDEGPVHINPPMQVLPGGQELSPNGPNEEAAVLGAHVRQTPGVVPPCPVMQVAERGRLEV